MRFDIQKVFGGSRENKEAQQGTDKPKPLIENSRMAWTYRDCAHAIGVTENALRKMVHRRQVPFVKLGKRVRFIREDIEAWLRKGATHVS